MLYDPHVLGGRIAQAALAAHDTWLVRAVCALCVFATVLLTAYRIALRAARLPAIFAGAALTVLCISTRLGTSFEPFDWMLFALVALLLERRRAPVAPVLAAIAVWACVTGGATFGALICLCVFAGTCFDERGLSARARALAAVALPVAVACFVQISGPPAFYGARVLYLDGLLTGNERMPPFQMNPNAAIVGFTVLVVVAAWYGLRKTGRAADALAFFAFALLAIDDVRALPFFAIAAAPSLAAVAAPAPPRVRDLSASWPAAVVAIAALLATAFALRGAGGFPPSPDVPLALELREARQKPGARILCTRPSWCDAAPAAGLVALLDTTAGFSNASGRELLRRVDNADGTWTAALARWHVDALIAPADAPIVSLLRAARWRVTATDSQGRALLQRATQ